MRKILFSVALVASGFVGHAQQDPQFSNFMFDKLSINPGYAGIDRQLCGTLFYRNQWMGFGDQPKTTLLNVHNNFDILRGGLGITFYMDKLGFQTNTIARLSYSYHLTLTPTLKLGMGISVGYIGVGYKATWIPPDGVATIGDDGSIPDANSSQGTYDLGVGFYLKGKQFYVGLSSMHLSESQLASLSFTNKRHYFLMAGYDWVVPGDPRFEIQPAMRLESDATATQVDVSVRGMYNKMFWLGAGYRIKEAVYPMLGVQRQLGRGTGRFGLSYDINTNELKNYSNNGLEFFLGYCMPLEKTYKPEKYKTVRFL